MNRANHHLSCVLLLLAPLLGACSQIDQDAQAASTSSSSASLDLGVCSPGETTADCETACSRMAACDHSPWAEDDHWSCTKQCVQGVFRNNSVATAQVSCLLTSGDGCVGVEECAVAAQATALNPAGQPADAQDPENSSHLPYAHDTEEYCELIANEFAECGAWETSQWTAQYFVSICTTWGNNFKRKLVRCTKKHEGTCEKIVNCFSLP